jgi:hypothetical protein
MDMVGMLLMQFLKDLFRACFHTLPTPMALSGQEMNVLRFKSMAKEEITHNQSKPQYTGKL